MSTSTLHNLLRDDYDAPPPGSVENHERDVVMSEEDELRIRPAFIRLLKKKIRPTINSIRKELAEEEEGKTWLWSRSSTYRALLRIGFVFDQYYKTYYERMREASHNIAYRVAYISKFFQYEREGRQIVYMDESWINKNTAPRKVWHDGTPETVDAVPPGKGPRWILIGAGCRTGWIHDSFRMWKGNVQSEDYHDEMNADIMVDWMQRYLLPNVAANAVIVMDRAKYHTACTEETKGPQSSWTKRLLAEYIVAQSDEYTLDFLLNDVHEVEDDQGRVRRYHGMLKAGLLELAKEVAPPKEMRVHKVTNEWNAEHGTDIRILFLPIAHPQLNPIEMMWCDVKSYVSKNNFQDTNMMPRIKVLAEYAVNNVDPTLWEKFYLRSRVFALDCMDVDDADDIDDIADNVEVSDADGSDDE